MFRIQRFFRLSSRVVCVQKKVSSSTACIATIISPENKLPLPTASSRFISFTEFRHQASNDVPDEIPIAERIEKLLKNKKVVIFMKGIPSDPMCGFSNAVVQVLRMHGVEDYDAHNVLDDEALRQGIKEFSDWPTIPQIYFNGEFIGGCDILLQMHQNGELIDEMEKIGIKSALFNKIEIEVTMATAGMNIFSERNQMIVDLGCGPNNPPDAIPPQSFLSYTSDKHPRHLLDILNNLRKNMELWDVVLLVGNSKIYAHRVVLAGCSPYFRAMFTGELAESRQTEVAIRDIEEKAMDLLIEFAYTSHITVEENNVQSLLPAACLLQMVEIQEICCEFLKRQLDPSNCLGIRAFADTHACRELLRVAEKFVQANFQEVKESEEFLLLPPAQLIDIIASDDLNIRSEEQVYSAIIAWVKFSVNERPILLPKILQHVRLPLLSPKFLVGVVGSEPLIRSSEQCRDLLDEAKNYLLLPQERSLMQGPRTRPRRPITRDALFAVGGWCSGDAISSVERFDPETNEWKLVAPMSKRRCGVGVAVLDNLLYAVGGHDGTSYLNSVERYDPQTDQWSSDVAPTSTCRTSVGVAVLEGYLYAVGGQDGVSCLDIVERYDPKTNRWSKVASMNIKRLGVAVAVLGPYLYAVGGSDGTTPWDLVERYEPRTNKWTPVASMSTARKHLGCAVYKGLLYAVGGRDDTTELNSVERYNPKTNTWNTVVAMNSRRSGVGLAVVNGQLLAVGGFDGSTYLKSTEVYDPEQNTWRMFGGMHYKRLGGGVGVIRLPQN